MLPVSPCSRCALSRLTCTRRAARRRRSLGRSAVGLPSRQEPSGGDDRILHFPLIIAVLISFVVSCLFVVITVLSWINPTYRLVSVDSPVYFQWLTQMRGLNVNSALSFALINDRSAFLIFTYVLSFLVSPINIMQFMPALLIPLFCIVSLFVVRLTCGFREAWVYTVLMVPFSLQALGLIYSGYFANILAVIFVYIYFILLLWVFRSRSSLGVFGLLSACL